MIERLFQDLRYSFRMMIKSPVLTGAAIIALALGIGANTAIFSVVNAVLLRPLPYDNPDTIIRLWGTQTHKGTSENYFAALDYVDLRDQNEVFEHLAAFRNWPFTITGSGEPVTVWGQRVTSSFFPVLGVYPAVGRAFTPEEELEAKNTVVILSHKFWQSRFNGDRNILGQTLTINNAPRTVVGIMPPDFEFPQGSSSVLYIPYTFSTWEMSRGRESMSVMGRLKPGASLDQARANVELIAAQIEQQYPDTNTGKSIRVLSLHEDIAGKIRPALLILLGAVGIVLLIACANVANLMLARALARQKEIALRIALGATRARLIKQLLTESVLLALTGGLLGFLLSYWGLNLIIGLSTDKLPRVKETSIDLSVLGFTLATSVLMGILFGLVPALQASRPDLNDTLKEGGAAGTSIHKQRASSSLVVLEIAVAVMLLIGAGLMIRSFIALQNTNPGFNVENVMTTSTFLSRARYPEFRQQSNFYQQVLERLEALPGVQSVGATSMLPFNGLSNPMVYNVVGRPPSAAGEELKANCSVISPSYFRSMGIPLLKGRDFSETDNDRAEDVVMINETMARRVFGDEDPIGKSLNLSDSFRRPCKIIGVVGDAKFKTLTAEPEPEVFVPYLQRPWLLMAFTIRGSSSAANIAPMVRNAVWSVDKEQPLEEFKPMREVVAKTVAEPRFYTVLLTIFSGVALVLAAVGIYGVVSYSVTQRTREIGIRLALGANRNDIYRLILKQALTLAVVGVIVGLAGAFALTRLLSSLLVGVSPTDPSTFIIIPLLLCILVLAASYFPARRAIRIKPQFALRQE